MSLALEPPPTPTPPPGWKDYLAVLLWLGIGFGTWMLLLKIAKWFMAQSLT